MLKRMTLFLVGFSVIAVVFKVVLQHHHSVNMSVVIPQLDQDFGHQFSGCITDTVFGSMRPNDNVKELKTIQQNHKPNNRQLT